MRGPQPHAQEKAAFAAPLGACEFRCAVLSVIPITSLQYLFVEWKQRALWGEALGKEWLRTAAAAGRSVGGSSVSHPSPGDGTWPCAGQSAAQGHFCSRAQWGWDVPWSAGAPAVEWKEAEEKLLVFFPRLDLRFVCSQLTSVLSSIFQMYREHFHHKPQKSAAVWFQAGEVLKKKPLGLPLRGLVFTREQFWKQAV